MAKEIKQTRNKILNCKVTPQEYEYYKQKAREQKLNLSTLIRIALIQYLKDE